MKSKNNELFLYKERAFPMLRDPRKNFLERAAYVWKFACTGNKIQKESINDIGRFLDKSRPMLIQKIVNFYNLNKDSKIVLLSNAGYRGNFTTQDSHGYAWIHQERGISNEVLKLFADNFRDKGISIYEKEISVSARYFFK